MPLQIEITGPVITNAGEQFHNKLVLSEFTLNIWPEGVDKKTTEPVIKDKKFRYQQKTEVVGKATDELAKRVEDLAVVDIQKVIDEHKAEVAGETYTQVFEKDARITQMAPNIQEVLNG